MVKFGVDVILGNWQPTDVGEKLKMSPKTLTYLGRTREEKLEARRE